MFSNPTPKPSTSMVLSNIPISFKEEDVISLFSNLPQSSKNDQDTKPIKVNVSNVIFHYYGPNLFLNKATVIFPDEESARKVVFTYFGRQIGDTKMTIQYSYRPHLPYKQEINIRKPLDDVGLPNENTQDNVFKCEWKNLPAFPSTIPQRATMICLRFNKIKNILYQDLHPSLDSICQNLTYLNLKGNNIKIIEHSISFPKLTFCDLSFNKLSIFPQLSTFGPNIEILFLNNNRLTNLDESFSQSKLKSLHIQYNHIKSIPALPNSVNWFDFDHNEIESISDFSVQSIDSIQITHNKLSSFPKFDTSSVMNYSNNLIKNIEITALNPSLTTLILHSNQITEIPESLFTDFPELTKVDFSNNCIEKVPDSFSISKLSTFNISFNPKLTTLPIIPQCLSDLRISFCNINDIESSIPIENNLIILFVNGNKIRKLPDYLYKIELLFASGNFLVDFPLLYQEHNTQFRDKTAFIDLSHNLIQEITSEAISEKVSIPTFCLFDLSFNDLKLLPLTKDTHKSLIFTPKSEIKLQGNLNLGNTNAGIPGSRKETTIASTLFDSIDSIDISHTSLVINDFNENIREIITDEAIKLNDQKLKHSTIPLIQNFVFKYNSNDHSDVGYAEMIGDRGDMEDALIIRQNFFVDEAPVDMFGLFDGHGGRSAARIGAMGIPSILTGTYSIFKKSPFKSVNSAIGSLNEVLIEMNETSGTTFDLVFIDRSKIDKKHRHDSTASTTEKLTSSALKLITGSFHGSDIDLSEKENCGRLLITHLGDSRVLVINDDYEIRFVTEDMRCDSSRSELERLKGEKIPCRKMKAGGYLGVSASIGDMLYPGIRHVPMNYEMEILNSDKWLVLACDGVFEELENEDVSNIIKFVAEKEMLDMKKGSIAKRAATLIRDYAYECGSTDNISVIVVDLKP